MRKTKGKVLMLLENCYPADIRPRKEAQVLLESGYKVSVIALRHSGDKFSETIDGVQVYRIPELTLFQKSNSKEMSNVNIICNRFKSIIGYISEYLYFTSACLIMSLYVLIKDGFNVIHAHNPPDTLFVVGGFFRILGKKFIFDHHDLSPELYLTRVSGDKNIIYKGLILCEKLSCKLANVIICTNESYKKIEINRHNIDIKKIYIVRNNPIIEECVSRKERDYTDSTNQTRTKLIFLGSINPQDGVDLLIQSLHYLKYELNKGDFICNIIGDGDSLPQVKQLAESLKLTENINFTGMVYDREKIKEYLSSSDIGVEPASDNELNKHSTFIKIMEYMAAGIPIVAYDLKETRFSVNGNAILINSGDVSGFAKAIAELMNDKELRTQLGKDGFERVTKELTWENTALNLKQAYKSLSL